MDLPSISGPGKGKGRIECCTNCVALITSQYLETQSGEITIVSLNQELLDKETTTY